MNKRHYEHTLPTIRGSLSNTYVTVRISTETQCGVTIWKPYSDGLMFGLVVK